MAKKERKKATFACKVCGKVFNGGRDLGKHYLEEPTHKKTDTPTKSGAKKSNKAEPEANDLIVLGIKRLQVEIGKKEAELAKVNTLAEDIAALKKQKEATIKTLPKEVQEKLKAEEAKEAEQAKE